MSRPRSYDASGVALWQRCPRRFWFERVQAAPLDHVPNGFSGLLGQAAHAGIALGLQEPSLGPERVMAAMCRTFESGLSRSEARPQAEALARARERLKGEYLDLVLRLREDERVQRIEWTDVEAPVHWRDAHDRLFAGRLNALGRVKEDVVGFGWDRGEMVDVLRGTYVLVDWRFGRRVDVSPTALALNLPLAFWQRGLHRTRYEDPRAFVAVARDLLPPTVARDEEGGAIPHLLEELNPDYLAAFADGRPVDDDLRAAAEASRRRFSRDGKAIPKRLRRPNPRWEVLTGLPRGPLFHEAHIAWSVVRPAIGRAILEIEAAAAAGREDAYPARGAETFACASCPFRGRCLAAADAAATDQRQSSPCSA